MPKIVRPGILDDTGLRAGINACAATIGKRREISKLVALIIAYAMIPVVWLLPFYEIKYFSMDGQVISTIVWAWGWFSSEYGWFSSNPYLFGSGLILMCVAVWYAVSITGSMLWQAADARRGHRPAKIYVLILIAASCQLFVGTFLLPMLWMGVAQAVLGFALWFARASWLPTPTEALQFRTAAQAAVQACEEMQTRSDALKIDVDAIKRDLDWLTVIAQRTGVKVSNELLAGYKALPGLEARCSLNEAIWIDGTVGVDQLLAISGLKKEQFDSLLLDMCRELNLYTDGKIVSANHKGETRDLIKMIDEYFIRWRETEAEKLGKI